MVLVVLLLISLFVMVAGAAVWPVVAIMARKDVDAATASLGVSRNRLVGAIAGWALTAVAGIALMEVGGSWLIRVGGALLAASDILFASVLLLVVMRPRDGWRREGGCVTRAEALRWAAGAQAVVTVAGAYGLYKFLTQ
jgi:hypothetical protein